MYPKIQTCYSLSDFEEKQRKFIKRYEKRNPQLLSQPFVEYILSYEELCQIADGVLRLEEGDNLQAICQEVRENYMKKFVINGEVYLLDGVQITNEDYYYFLVQPDTIDFYFSTCVGGLKGIGKMLHE